MIKYKQKQNIKVGDNVKNKLDKIGKKGTTYENIIDMLINSYLEKK